MSDSYCFHSMVVDDCVSCWRGVVNRQHAHIQRLRAMIVELGGEEDLTAHDQFWFGGNADPLPPGDEVNPPETNWLIEAGEMAMERLRSFPPESIGPAGRRLLGLDDT